MWKGVGQVEDAAKDEELAAKLEAALNGGEDAEGRLIEERRRRRQAILAKHREQSQLSGAPRAGAWPRRQVLRLPWGHVGTTVARHIMGPCSCLVCAMKALVWTHNPSQGGEPAFSFVCRGAVFRLP